MSISALPAVPSTSSPTTFSADMDAFLAALPVFRTEVNDLAAAMGISGETLGAGIGAWLGTPSSANLLAALTTKTGTGNVMFGTAPTMSNPTIAGSITEGVYTITDGVSVNLNPANGTVQVWTLGASRTATAASFAAGQSMTLMIADGTAYALTFPTMTWVGGSAPTLATTGYTVVELWKIGSTLYGAYVGAVA